MVNTPLVPSAHVTCDNCTAVIMVLVIDLVILLALVLCMVRAQLCRLSFVKKLWTVVQFPGHDAKLQPLE